MSSSEGRVASGSALSEQPAGGAPMDQGVMTPSNKRANRSDDSAGSGGRLWVHSTGGSECDGEGSGDDDGFYTVTGKAVKGKALKKKMRLTEASLESFRKDGAARTLPKTPRKDAKASSARCAPNAPKTLGKPPTTGSAVTGPVTGVEGIPVTRPIVGRSLEDRVFIEFLGKSLATVNAVKVRAELNKLFGPLSAEAPPTATSVRVHLGGPDKDDNKGRLLSCTEICGYAIKVSEPREVARQRTKYVQRVIKGVPSTLSDDEILACLQEQHLPVLKVARIFKIQNKVKVPTLAVLIDLMPGTIAPTRLYIGFLSFKVHVYNPPPTRCFCCLSFAHVAKFCRKKQRCSICAGEHKHTDCDKRDQPKCAACGGPHPAMSNSCPKYIQAKTATAISVTEGKLYSDALRMVRTQERQKTSPPTSTPVASSSQGTAQAEPKGQRPPRETNRRRPKVGPSNAPASAVPNGQQGEVAQVRSTTAPITAVPNGQQEVAQVTPTSAPAAAVPDGQLEEVAQVDGGKTQRDALEALTRACTVFVKAMETGDGAAITTARLIEILVSTIHVAFNINLNTVCGAVTNAYAVAAEASGATSATSATPPVNRHH